jgi:hypothetical protein
MQVSDPNRRLPRSPAEVQQRSHGHEHAVTTATSFELFERARERLGDGAGEMGVLAFLEELTGSGLRFVPRA